MGDNCKKWCVFAALIMFLLIPESISAKDMEISILNLPCFVGKEERRELVEVRTDGQCVWVNGMDLAECLGYASKYQDEMFEVFNREEGKVVIFYTDSTKVETLLLCSTIEYEAPFETLYIDGKSWIPLDFATIMLDSSILIIDNKIYLQEPGINILKALFPLTQNGIRFAFDWNKDFGYSDFDVNLIGGASGTANMFNELLKDPSSYVSHVINQFRGMKGSYDDKYGRDLALLVMTESNDELKAMITETEDIYKLISPEGNLASALERIGQTLENDVRKWQEACDSLLEEVDGQNLATFRYNTCYSNLQKVLKRQSIFENTGGLINSMQNNISNELEGKLKFLNVLSKSINFVSYYNEFAQQDEFAVNALADFCKTTKPNKTISKSSLESMKRQVNHLESNALQYMISGYLEEHGIELIEEIVSKVSKKSIIDVIGGQAEIIRMTWDLASDYIPFIKDGLSSTEQFELALYAQCLQENAFQAVRIQRENIVKNGQLMEDQLYNLAQKYYVFLKSCMITREAAVASLASKKYTLGEDVIGDIEEYEYGINKEIVEYLSLLKRAQVDKSGRLNNENMAFGFLPSDNKEYLKIWNDSKLVEILEKEKELSQGDGIFALYCQKCEELEKMYGKGEKVGSEDGQYSYLKGVCIVDLFDFNGDNADDLFVLYSDGQLTGENLNYYSIPQAEAYHFEVWTVENGSLKLLCKKTNVGYYNSFITEYWDSDCCFITVYENQQGCPVVQLYSDFSEQYKGYSYCNLYYQDGDLIEDICVYDNENYWVNNKIVSEEEWEKTTSGFDKILICSLLSTDFDSELREYNGTKYDFVLQQTEDVKEALRKSKKGHFLTAEESYLTAYLEEIERVRQMASDNMADYPYEYTLYDIDKNGTPELIIKTGTCEAEFWFYIYTINGEELYKCGEIGGSHLGLYGGNSAGMVGYMAHMGGYAVFQYTLVNKTVSEQLVTEGYTEENYPKLSELGYGEYDMHLEYCDITIPMALYQYGV